MYDVAIIGAGPTGLMLAAELRLHDLRVIVLEREAEPLAAVRALGLHARSIEILDQRGVLEPFLAHGQTYRPGGYFAGVDRPWPERMDTSHSYVLAIPQPRVELLLGERAEALGAVISRVSEVVQISQTNDSVEVGLANGAIVRARFVVGCDGGRSTVRKAVGIAFPGEESTAETLLGEMEVTTSASEIAEVVATVRARHRGFGVGPSPSGEGLYRVVVPADEVTPDRDRLPSLDDVRRQLRAYAGTDFGVNSPRWLSRFGNATRLADRYRVGRVFLAGDSAHVHPPLGGQGLNLGIQDALNLGWKLAAAVNGWGSTDLLDTYETERRPVAEEVLRNTRAQGALLSGQSGTDAIRQIISELMMFENVNRFLIEKITALSVRYDFESEVPLVGRHLRDIPVQGSRLYSLMHRARGLLVDRTGQLSSARWASRVDGVSDPLAEFDAPAVLLRPDGHVAWAGTDQEALDAVMWRWFGAPDANA